MQRIVTGIALATIYGGSAMAGGVERSAQSTAILFENGTHAELSFAHVSPDVSGTLAAPAPPLSSGDMLEGYTTTTLGFKTALNESLDLALVVDQPIGADVNYPAGTSYPARGATATLASDAVTALLRYEMPSHVSLIGGLRVQRTEGRATLPYIPGGYTLGTSSETDFGYVLGIAWEKPAIAARVSLTYNSAIEHDFSATENGAPSLPFSTTVPQSLNLEAQTGIARDTLLFGSVRWVDWTAFDISPAGYVAGVGSPLVSYHDDTITYSLGLGRRFSKTWSGAIILGHEPGVGGFAGNLGPTDGFTSVGLAATYTGGGVEITGGARYIWLGDARTESPVTPGATFANFTDNSGVALGIKMAYTF